MEQAIGITDDRNKRNALYQEIAGLDNSLSKALRKRHMDVQTALSHGEHDSQPTNVFGDADMLKIVSLPEACGRTTGSCASCPVQDVPRGLACR